MKKLIFAVLLLVLIPLNGAAQNAVISSGMTTSDRLIATGNCYIYGMEIVSGASTATVSLYDSLTISGTTVLQGQVSTAQAWNGCRLLHPIEVFTGVYADVTGTGAGYTVYYKCK